MKFFIQIFMLLLFPNRCEKCFSSKIRSDNEQYLDGHTLCEYDEVCNDCGYYHVSWAYGSYSLPRYANFWDRLEYIQMVEFPQAPPIQRPGIYYGTNFKFIINGEEYSF